MSPLSAARYLFYSQPLADSRVDFACIDQDNRVLQLAGINSLISCELRIFSSLLFKYAMLMIAEFYAHTDAMRADYVLIPVRPRKQNSWLNTGKEDGAGLSRIYSRASPSFDKPKSTALPFGLRVPARVQDEAIDEEMKLHGMVHRSLKFLPRVSGETLRRLFGTSEGGWFSTQVRVRVIPVPRLASSTDCFISRHVATQLLPSTGDLTAESDRLVVAGIENDVRYVYSTFSIVVKKTRFLQSCKKKRTLSHGLLLCRAAQGRHLLRHRLLRHRRPPRRQPCAHNVLILRVPGWQQCSHHLAHSCSPATRSHAPAPLTFARR